MGESGKRSLKGMDNLVEVNWRGMDKPERAFVRVYDARGPGNPKSCLLFRKGLDKVDKSK